MGARERPSLWRFSLFAITWHISFWLGWGLVLAAALQMTSLSDQLSVSPVQETGLELLLVAALVIFGELRPVVALDSWS